MRIELFNLKTHRFNELVYDNEFSKLGDSLTNFVFSLALTKIFNRYEGVRVSNFVLSEALKKSTFNYLIKKRQNRHEKGNIVESIILFSWVKEYFEILDLVKLLSERISSSTNRVRQKEIYIHAYVYLLDTIQKKLSQHGEILAD